MAPCTWRTPAARNWNGAKRAQPRGRWSSSIVTRLPPSASPTSIVVVAAARMRSNGDSSTSWRQTIRPGVASTSV